jgi:WD40 repeat protein
VSTKQGQGALPGEPTVVHVHDVQSVQVGDHNIQYISHYNYGPGIWTDSPGQLPAGNTDGYPYRGLRAFELRDAPFFFGRDRAVDELMERMDQEVRETGLVVVSGVSGAGKSSLLRAGVLPRIRSRGLASMPGSSGWPCLLLTPGRTPLDDLAVQVATLAKTDARQAVRGLADDPTMFAYSARQAALAQYKEPGSARLVLIIDQFELLFTQCEDDAQRRAYVAALHAAATGGGSEPAALVVLGVRADFEARCAEFPELTDAINNRRLLTAMTERQLRLAITGPADKVGATVEEALVEALLAELRARSANSAGAATVAGALPLLSYALDQTWRRRSGATLTLADYERTGGIEQAVADSAQQAYDALSLAQRDVARQVFLQLTAVSDDGGTDTAVPASRAELMAGKDPGDAQTVLDAFAGERLLTLDADTVQISHEVLLTAWPLFRDTWLAQTRDDRVLRTRLRVTTGEWDKSGRNRSYLYRGAVLASATAVVERYPQVSADEREFLRASVRAGRRRIRLVAGVLAGLTALVVLLGVVTGVAFNANATSVRERDDAVAGELATESEALGDANPALARLEAVASWRIDPSSAQAGYAMRNAAVLPGIAVLAGASGPTAFSPNGRILAVGVLGGVQLWNVASRLPIGRPLHVSDATSAAFSPNGAMLAIGTENDGTQLWDVARRRLIGVLSETGNTVTDVAFSPDGDSLAVANVLDSPSVGSGSTAQVWNVASRQLEFHLAALGDGAFSVAFSPDGRTIAVAISTQGAELWQYATAQQATMIPGAGSATSATFSPDGGTLVTGGNTGVQLLNASTLQPVGRMATNVTNDAESMAYSPNGKILALADQQGTVQLWDTAAGQPVSIPFASPSGAGSPLAFSPNGEILAITVAAGVELVSVAAAVETPARTLPASTSNSDSLRSPDGRITAVSTASGIYLRSTASRQLAGAPLPGTGNVQSMAFSPDGTMLAVAVEGGAQLWELSARKLVATIADTGYLSLSFSHNGKLLGVSDSTHVHVLDTANGAQVGPTIDLSGVNSTAISPDGTWLAVATTTGTELYTVGGTLQADGNLPSGTVTSAAFSPDDSVLAAGTAFDTLLWDVATKQQIGPALPSNVSDENDPPGVVVSWSSSGTLTAIPNTARAELWNVGYLLTARTPSYLCSLAGQTLSREQWPQYAQGAPYVNVCP